MPAAINSRYHNTTVRLPREVYERAKSVILKSRSSSLNEFVVQAIEEKVQRLTEAEIDAAFAQMAHDPDYTRASTALAGEFEKSDWEAFKTGDSVRPELGGPTHGQPRKTRTAKTRSR